jgi:hypothetical protein
MTHRQTTPLALMLAAALLLVISFIPAGSPPAKVAPPVTPDLFSWVASTPLERDEHRLALVFAVHASAWALDQMVLSMAAGDAGIEPLSAPSPVASVRRAKPARPMMPFYSFASTVQRPQES